MSVLSGVFYVIFFIFHHVYCQTEAFKAMELVETKDAEFQDKNVVIETLIQNFQHLALESDNQLLEAPAEVDNLYNQMIPVLENLIDSVKNSNNAYKFLKAKGIDRIAASHLDIGSDDVKTGILLLLKTLFDVAPTATTTAMPITVLDRLLTIFEKENLALKAHVLDVLYVWLPGNPKVQERVMRLKGLQPFYTQMAKLDTNVIKILLDLFNKILAEHIVARGHGEKNAIVDIDKLKSYNRAGLLERMETPGVCHGLLNIFIKSWSYNSNDNNIIMTVFELLKNVKQYCLKMYKGKTKAVNLFTALHAFVVAPENVEAFEQNGINVTEVSLLLEEYVNTLKNSAKEEF